MTKEERSCYVRGVLEACLEVRATEEATAQVCRDLHITGDEITAVFTTKSTKQGEALHAQIR